MDAVDYLGQIAELLKASADPTITDNDVSDAARITETVGRMLRLKDDHMAECGRAMIALRNKLDKAEDELSGIVAARNAEHDRAEAYSAHLGEIADVLLCAGIGGDYDIRIDDMVRALVAERDEWKQASVDYAKTIDQLRATAAGKVDELANACAAREAAIAERDAARAERDIAQRDADMWRKDAIHAKDDSLGWQARYEGMEAALRIAIGKD